MAMKIGKKPMKSRMVSRDASNAGPDDEQRRPGDLRTSWTTTIKG